MPGGALPVTGGDEVLPVVNALLKLPFDVILATQDWHPPKHGSFASAHGRKVGEIIDLEGILQVLWPDHCVQGSLGAEFHPGWDKSRVEKVFHKGIEKNIDSYSTFFDNGHLRSTGLDLYLKKRGIKDIYLAGLATDYCVKYSALDACQLGFNTYVVVDGCRGVNLHSFDSDQALQEMKKAGAHLVKSGEILAKMNP